MKVKSLSHSDPMDCSLPCSSVHGILQARILEWGAIAFSTYKSGGLKKKKTPHGWSGMNKGMKKFPENQIVKDNIKGFHFCHKDNEVL